MQTISIGAGGGSGPDVFGGVIALEVDSLGRMYVADWQAAEIRLFEPSGDFIRTFGSKGKGPGELSDLSGLVADADGNLWVMNPAAGLLSVFDTTGVFLTSHRHRHFPFTVPWDAVSDAAGNLYLRQRLSPASVPVVELGLVRHAMEVNEGLQPVDTFVLPQVAERMQVQENGPIREQSPVPFSPSLKVRVSRGGDVWISRTDEYRLTQLDFDGDTIRIIERAFSPMEVGAGERDSVSRAADMDPDLLPEFKPAIRDFILDRNGMGLWVHVDGDESGLQRWDVFDSRGRFIGAVGTRLSLVTVPWPILRSGKLYAVVQDDLDIPYVVRLALPGELRVE